MDSTWHIWVIKLNKFEKVEEYIKGLSEIEEYLYPTMIKEYKTGKVVKRRRVPLYSGYLFMRYIDTPEVFHKLNTFPFITTYVGKCTRDDLELVRKVKNLEYLNYVNKVIHVDDVVKINSGPFKDFSGTVISTSSSNICVVLSVFGRSVNVTFNKDDADILKRDSCGKEQENL